MTTKRGVSAISEVFAAAQSARRAALIPYITLGYPTLERSIEMAEATIAGGADILELGIPFSDPLADGPIIQHATQAALDQGTTVAHCLEAAGTIRKRHPEIPLVFMGYLNPLLAYGEERFCAACQTCGVDGLIVPDLPPEEAAEIEAHCRSRQLATIFLLAPNTPEERMRCICSRSQGYIYLVSMTGTTGTRETLPKSLDDLVGRARAVTDKPIAVGFGISTPDHAAAVARIADGVIVGSAIVRRCSEGAACVEAFVRSLRNEMDYDIL